MRLRGRPGPRPLKEEISRMPVMVSDIPQTSKPKQKIWDYSYKIARKAIVPLLFFETLVYTRKGIIHCNSTEEIVATTVWATTLLMSAYMLAQNPDSALIGKENKSQK